MVKKMIKGNVRAKTRCFVRNCLRQEGEIFFYEGPENGCLELLTPEPPPEKCKEPPGAADFLE